MKKRIKALIALGLAMAMVTGCGSKEEAAAPAPAPAEKTEEPAEELTSVTEEDLTIPFGDTTYDIPVSEEKEVVANEPIEELNLDEINTPNIELPDLDSIVTEDDDADDVWKF